MARNKNSRIQNQSKLKLSLFPPTKRGYFKTICFIFLILKQIVLNVNIIFSKLYIFLRETNQNTLQYCKTIGKEVIKRI